MKSHVVSFFFHLAGSKRKIGAVLMLGALSASVAHARNAPFAPADHVGPYKIGYNRVELVDSSRDVDPFGGRTLVTHIWYPIDDAAAAGAVPVIYDSGLASLALFGLPVSHAISRSPFGALVDANSTLPPSGDSPGSCNAPPFPLCGSSVIVGLPISSHGPFPLLMFSHGAILDPHFYVSLTEYLASHGYIVVAPEHTGNRFVDNYASTITRLGCGPEALPSRPCLDDVGKSAVDRPQDIRFVLDQVLAGRASVDPAAIDASRIGMYGHSFGGYTTLVVGGGSGFFPPDSRVKAIAALSPFTFGVPGADPVIENINVPTLVSFGEADKLFGIDFADQGRAIFTALDTRAVGEKYRVELERGVHSGFTDICAFLAGNLEVIQHENAGPLDPINLLAFLINDNQIPQLPAELLGKANAGPQSICLPDLFYRPDNFAVWNTVTLQLLDPQNPPIPLSALLFPPDLIPGYIDADSLEYTPSLASGIHLPIVNTELVAFFNKHLKGDMRYHHYLLPGYAHAKQPEAEVAYCKATPGNKEVCFDEHNTD
jgi:predicted dienelactone hydrolase